MYTYLCLSSKKRLKNNNKYNHLENKPEVTTSEELVVGISICIKILFVFM